MFFSKRQKGQGLVEFALILPALLMILLGIIEAAVVFQSYLGVQHAAREAARFAVTMQPPQGMMIVDEVNPIVECDDITPKYDKWGNTCDPNETWQEWQDRRVDLIQEVAAQQATGLPKEHLGYYWDTPVGESPDPLIQHSDGAKSRFFGVMVKGFDIDSEQFWFAGLEGLPVMVTVYYNVQLLDPLYEAIIPGGYVRVLGEAVMINEGVTVGLAGEPPPAFATTEVPPAPTATDTPTPGAGATATHTPTPTNTPEPTGTPTDTPTPTATPLTPYIVASQYEDVHASDALTAWLYQHPTGDTYDLWWFTDTPTGAGQHVTTMLASNIAVDGDGVSGPIEFYIPNDTEGTYYLVSFSHGTTAPEVGRSALITVEPLPPDLVVQNLSVPESISYLAGDPLVVTLDIANLTATGVYSTYFDLDIYVDPEHPPLEYVHEEPPEQFPSPGYHKQWQTNIGPYGTITATIPITDIIELWSGGQHEVWARVDTSNQVDEFSETNNITGPVTTNAGCGAIWEDDFEDGSLDSRWTFRNIPSSRTGSATPNSPAGRLTVSTNGTTLWGGDNSFSFLYQMVEGDFDARVQVISPMNYTSSYAKIGLMVRQNEQRDSPYIMINRHSYRWRSQKIQYAVRANRGTDPSPSGYRTGNSLPVWLRLVRQGDTFDLYFSTSTANPPADGDWTLASSYTVGAGDDFDPDVPLMVGIAAAAYHSNHVHQGVVDNFWICTAGSGAPPIPRYGNRTCSQPIQRGTNDPVGGGSFELGWDAYWDNGEEPEASSRDSGENHTQGGNYSFLFHDETYGLGAGCPGGVPLERPLHPWLAQGIPVPGEAGDVVEMPDGSTEPMIVSIDTSFFYQVEPRATPQPDPFLLTIRDVSGGSPITLTNTGTFSNPGSILIASGDETTHVGDWGTKESYDLVTYMTTNITNYAGQNLQLYWYAPNEYDPCDPASPVSPQTWFYVDDVSVELCTTVPIPTIDPTLATLSGKLKSEELEENLLQGTLVWAYGSGGELYTTYSIHDATYHFYDIPPGTYTIYSEVWVGTLLHWAEITIALPQGETEQDLVLN